MHRRQWDAKTKARIMLDGLQGKPVAAICNDHQFSPPCIISGVNSF